MRKMIFTEVKEVIISKLEMKHLESLPFETKM